MSPYYTSDVKSSCQGSTTYYICNQIISVSTGSNISDLKPKHGMPFCSEINLFIVNLAFFVVKLA